jgi:outer membrane receptor protein involved in Fe transport
LCLASVASAQPAPASAPPEPEQEPRDEPTPHVVESLSLDVIGGPGLRPIRGPRVEALVSTGSYGTNRAAARATTTHRGFGLEIDGSVTDTGGYVPVARADRGTVDHAAARSTRQAGARIERTTDESQAHAYGRWMTDRRDAGVEHQNTDAAVDRYGGRWTHQGERVYVDLQTFGQRERLREERPRIAPDRSSVLLASEHAMPLSIRGGRGALKSRRLRALGLDHELVFGGGLVLASGEQEDTITPSLDQPMHMTTMSARRIRGDHRFLDAYIEDTVRFIRTLDVSGGLVIEKWSNLGGSSSISYGTSDGGMEVDTPDVSKLLITPTFGMTGHLDDGVAITARGYRGLRPPTLHEMYVPVLVGDALTAANPSLQPETVWTGEIGPALMLGRLTARAAMFHSSVENVIGSVTTDAPLGDGATRQRQNIGTARVHGVDAEASLRATKALLATVTYTFARTHITDAASYPGLVGKELAQAPRHRASALLTYDNPHLVTITGAVRYVGASYEDDRNSLRLGKYTLIDAIAARKLHGGISGFVAVDNLLDRRYLIGRTGVDTLGAPRMFHVGVRVDSSAF